MEEWVRQIGALVKWQTIGTLFGPVGARNFKSVPPFIIGTYFGIPSRLPTWSSRCSKILSVVIIMYNLRHLCFIRTRCI